MRVIPVYCVINCIIIKFTDYQKFDSCVWKIYDNFLGTRKEETLSVSMNELLSTLKEVQKKFPR